MGKIIKALNFWKGARFWMTVSLILLAFIVGCGVGQPTTKSTAANVAVPSFIQNGKSYRFNINVGGGVGSYDGQVKDVRSDGWILVDFAKSGGSFSGVVYLNTNACISINEIK